jgi:riboflavin synthase
MFTGIIEEMGVVKSMDRHLGGAKLRVLASTVLTDAELGASLAVNGACLTIVECSPTEFAVDLSPETLSVTTLGTVQAGSPVNLERAMKLGARLGGHMVTGHVDGIGTVRERRPDLDAVVLTIEGPPEVLRYCVAKGSITIDGVSMTINTVTDRTLSICIIPHTAKMTTLGLKIVGDTVNLETDLIGKYVERLLQERSLISPKAPPTIDRDYLQRHGLI